MSWPWSRRYKCACRLVTTINRLKVFATEIIFYSTACSIYFHTENNLIKTWIFSSSRFQVQAIEFRNSWESFAFIWPNLTPVFDELIHKKSNFIPNFNSIQFCRQHSECIALINFGKYCEIIRGDMNNKLINMNFYAQIQLHVRSNYNDISLTIIQPRVFNRTC